MGKGTSQTRNVVADEDYATVAVPDEGRSHWSVSFFALSGIGTALFYMQIGSIVTLQFGTKTAFLAITYASIVGAISGAGVAFLAVRTGFGTNLLARSLLGFRGGAVFSLVMGLTGLTYFVAEATIMAAAVHAALPNLSINTILVSMTFLLVPILWFGMLILGRVQAVTLVAYVILLGAAIVLTPRINMVGWLEFDPAASMPFGSTLSAAIAIMNGVVFITALVIADFARFVDRRQQAAGVFWLGVAFPVFCFAGAGLLGMHFALVFREPNPGVYFVRILGYSGTLFAIATQLRINVSNMYLGSLAFANVLFQTLGISARERTMTLVFAVIASGLFISHLGSYLTSALAIIGLFMSNFVILLLTDNYLVRRKIGATRRPELDQSEWRLPAFFCLVGSTACGLFLLSGMAGQAMQSLAGIFAAALAGASFIFLASLRGRFEKG